MKILLIVILATVASLPGNAQFQFGIKASANFCSLIVPDASINGRKVGFQAGALAAIPIASSFSIQPEVNYSIEGNKATPNGSAYITTETYINVPVLIKYKRPSGFFAETGPQIGFLLSANISGGPGSGDIKPAYKPADLSWAFGFGYFVKAINAGIDARYNIDFTNDLASRYSGGGSAYNSVIQVGVFYLFGKGK
jgi:Outer membrane protein beta-barrel domain